MPYLIAYDIANPRRLRRVARRLERKAIRVQKSVYRFHGDEAALRNVVAELRPMLDLKKDVLAAWRITSNHWQQTMQWGVGLARPHAALILSPTQVRHVEEPSS